MPSSSARNAYITAEAGLTADALRHALDLVVGLAHEELEGGLVAGLLLLGILRDAGGKGEVGSNRHLRHTDTEAVRSIDTLEHRALLRDALPLTNPRRPLGRHKHPVS